MYSDWSVNALVVAVTALVVSAVVLLHYEGLNIVSRYLATRHERQPRRKVLYAVLSGLSLHVAEIWVFGLTLWLLIHTAGAGHVQGAEPLLLFDAVYLAATTFTTVGFGDLAPVGPIRFLSGSIALTGFVLITWSASFTFLEMERYWRR
jgi:hypothetical protein